MCMKATRVLALASCAVLLAPPCGKDEEFLV